MARKRFTAESIIIKLREAEVGSIPWSGLEMVPGLT